MQEKSLAPFSVWPITALADETVGGLLKKIRSTSVKGNLPVVIVDDLKHVVGIVDIFDLIRHQDSVKLDSIAQSCRIVQASKTKEYLVNFAIKHQMIFVPLVNNQNKFIGVFDTKSIIETLRTEHIEDLHKLSGIKKEKVSASLAITEPPIISVWHRLPWLLVGLVGSFFATFVLASFKTTLERNISLAFFLPGIVYLADAIGTQTETIVIRGLSLSWKSFKKSFLRELLSGLVIGVILGGISFVTAYFFNFPLQISFIVFTSIVFAGGIATTVGLLLPYVFIKIGLDPAFGSGPLATVIQDVLSILIFLAISKVFLFVF